MARLATAQEGAGRVPYDSTPATYSRARRRAYRSVYNEIGHSPLLSVCVCLACVFPVSSTLRTGTSTARDILLRSSHAGAKNRQSPQDPVLRHLRRLQAHNQRHTHPPSRKSSEQSCSGSDTWGRREQLLVKPVLVPPGDDDGHRLHSPVAELEKASDLARHHVAADSKRGRSTRCASASAFASASTCFTARDPEFPGRGIEEQKRAVLTHALQSASGSHMRDSRSVSHQGEEKTRRIYLRAHVYRLSSPLILTWLEERRRKLEQHPPLSSCSRPQSSPWCSQSSAS